MSVNKIYQFKVMLLPKFSRPKIWRRILVPARYNFGEFHVAIQQAMGWSGRHDHQFEMTNPETGKTEYIGQASDYNEFNVTICENSAQIYKFFRSPKDLAEYEYDAKDFWKHELLLERMLTAVPGQKYPRCTAGKGACPPEDCGGYAGYKKLLKILNDPKHEQFSKKTEWLENNYVHGFDPNEFHHKSVVFNEPEPRVNIRGTVSCLSHIYYILVIDLVDPVCEEDERKVCSLKVLLKNCLFLKITKRAKVYSSEPS